MSALIAFPLPEGGVNDVTLSTNGVQIASYQDVGALFTISPETNVIYRLDFVTNGVSFITNWYELKAEYTNCRADHIAIEMKTNGIPWWWMANIPCKQHRPWPHQTPAL